MNSKYLLRWIKLLRLLLLRKMGVN